LLTVFSLKPFESYNSRGIMELKQLKHYIDSLSDIRIIYKLIKGK